MGPQIPCPQAVQRAPSLLGRLGPRLRLALVVPWMDLPPLIPVSLCTCYSSHLEPSSPYTICLSPSLSFIRVFPKSPPPPGVPIVA